MEPQPDFPAETLRCQRQPRHASGGTKRASKFVSNCSTEVPEPVEEDLCPCGSEDFSDHSEASSSAGEADVGMGCLGPAAAQVQVPSGAGEESRGPGPANARTAELREDAYSSDSAGDGSDFELLGGSASSSGAELEREVERDLESWQAEGAQCSGAWAGGFDGMRVGSLDHGVAKCALEGRLAQASSAQASLANFRRLLRSQARSGVGASSLTKDNLARHEAACRAKHAPYSLRADPCVSGDSLADFIAHAHAVPIIEATAALVGSDVAMRIAGYLEERCPSGGELLQTVATCDAPDGEYVRGTRSRRSSPPAGDSDPEGTISTPDGSLAGRPPRATMPGTRSRA
mmetsp:Transcript_16646/g.52100  ORF Transcript_16646/g.52100 Transcript_16646/m.52100 type:complete len:346 (-) Transcript_16646:12-1049(-)